MTELALHIYDIVQNSIRAEATEIQVFITEDKHKNLYSIKICDNGKGIPADKLKFVTDAFYTTRTTRKVGLGLPLLKQNAEMADGSFELQSNEGHGTELSVCFAFDHLDRPYAGNIPSTMGLLISTNPSINIIYKHTSDNGTFGISTMEVQEAIGTENRINSPGIIKMVIDIIANNLDDIKAETDKTISNVE